MHTYLAFNLLMVSRTHMLVSILETCLHNVVTVTPTTVVLWRNSCYKLSWYDKSKYYVSIKCVPWTWSKLSHRIPNASFLTPPKSVCFLKPLTTLVILVMIKRRFTSHAEVVMVISCECIHLIWGLTISHIEYACECARACVRSITPISHGNRWILWHNITITSAWLLQDVVPFDHVFNTDIGSKQISIVTSISPCV